LKKKSVVELEQHPHALVGGPIFIGVDPLYEEGLIVIPLSSGPDRLVSFATTLEKTGLCFLSSPIAEEGFCL
jgi:hypothetical protein